MNTSLTQRVEELEQENLKLKQQLIGAKLDIDSLQVDVEYLQKEIDLNMEVFYSQIQELREQIIDMKYPNN